MGLLDHLWDDTLAGPRPDSGLGKLRKHATFSGRPISAKDPEIGSNSRSEAAAEETARVTRSIMIVKPPLAVAGHKDSPPPSPASGTPPISPLTSGTSPVSPFSGGGSGKEAAAFRFRRKSSAAAAGSSSFAFEKASGVGPRSPRPPYDL